MDSPKETGDEVTQDRCLDVLDFPLNGLVQDQRMSVSKVGRRIEEESVSEAFVQFEKKRVYSFVFLTPPCWKFQ